MVLKGRGFQPRRKKPEETRAHSLLKNSLLGGATLFTACGKMQFCKPF
jgi:hypothetical protein